MDALIIPANSVSVLVVDEEPAILLSIAKVLDANGMRALLARNGREAVEVAQRDYIPIDVILTNYSTGCTRSDRGFGICAWPRVSNAASFEFS